MSGPELITLGCRLNAAESEAMRGLAAGQDDLVIINSCAVTGEAVRQARKAVRAAAKRRPGARIVVTGCAAQLDPAMFAIMPEVSAVVGKSGEARVGVLQPSPVRPERSRGTRRRRVARSRSLDCARDERITGGARPPRSH